jgi:hypothetical protein
VRYTLVAHEEALLAATRISANSSYARELQTRISTLKRMASDRPSSSPSQASTPVSAPQPSPSKPPSAASKELQEKQRAIDEAFGF